ncbi:putative helicase [Calothrix sp. NIES-2100]|uniref:BREX-3 system P-loop-containing protein BrxF n=1 Tax=Calothrix sp. NIES-2100 TaxID=1954172 RepID=UPI000B5DF7CD|nr:putative helicase [Calothrix sp. NIES-2100]
MSLTEQQQRAAYANGSVAVIAGAGTGKTHMLAERYLYHLQNCEFSPLEIVAVTFTDKAAAELRSRIRLLVSQKLPERSDLLAELEAAQISTIHALAMRICREHPQAADVPPDFTVLDELEGILWVNQWLDEALDSLPVELYEKVPYSLMFQTLQVLLQDPIAAEKALAQGAEKWQQLAEELQEKALNELLQHPTWQQARMTLQTYAGQASDRLELETRQPALQAIDTVESGDNIAESLSVIVALKINVGSKKNWPEGALELVKETIKELRDLVQKALKDGLVNLEFGAADEQLKAMLPALQEAFSSVQKYINQQKSRSRVLDFADLEVGALRALQDEQVQFYYAQRWRAFLVDEFQDTNPVQSEILQRLTQNTLLTIVGDAKQSIYGFRRADVEVFHSWRDRIINSGGNEEVLTTSFRTHKLLIDNINSIFTPLLGDLHQNLDAHRIDCPNSYPPIQVYTVQAESDINKPQRLRVEACHLAELLKQMLDDKTLVYDKKTQTLRPMQPGDIAILSRTWQPLEVYGEALESVGIPVALAGGGNLLATREAKDGWALLRFLADPSDDLALVAVLRSPFFAVSDRVLFTFIQSQEENDTTEQDEQSKTNWWQKVKSSEIPELQRPVQVLNQLLRDRNLEPPTRLLQIANYLTGYTAVITNLPGAARREADWRGFVELVQQLEHGSSDVFAAVRRLKRLAAAEIEIPRLPLSANDAVALMTIHAAKGLEWSVVVIPDLTRSQPNTSETVYFDPAYGVALKLEDEQGETQKPVLYVCLEHLRKQREEAEALRVLYVALTRARDQLILTATDESGGSFSRLAPGLMAAGITINTIPFNSELAQPPVPPEPPLPPEPHSLLINSVGSGLFELPVTALSEYAQCPKKFAYRFIQGHPGIGSGVGTARRVGSLTHLALERGIRDLETLAGFDVSLPKESVSEALQLAQRFDEVADFAQFQQGQWELPVNLNVGHLTFNGIVDLLGTDWVLDFKTDQEIDPQHHRFQLWAYAQATGRTNAHIAYLRHDYLHRFSNEELQTTGQEAEILVQNILNGHFVANASHRNCGFCAYGEICDERYQATGEAAESTILQLSDTQIQNQEDSATSENSSSSANLLSEVNTQPEQANIAEYELISTKISSYFPQVVELYYRLIIVLCDRPQKINFRQIAEISNNRYINVNLELSRKLLELTQRQRALNAEELLKAIIGNTDNKVHFLDHLEILFDRSLQLDPLQCLKNLARNRTIVAQWDGIVENNHLIYAELDHPEYRRYPVKDFLIVNLEQL